MAVTRPTNPLTRREERIIEANSELGGEDCPECGRTIKVLDLCPDGTLYASHEDDRFGLASRSPRGETDGCRLSEADDPTR